MNIRSFATALTVLFCCLAAFSEGNRGESLGQALAGLEEYRAAMLASEEARARNDADVYRAQLERADHAIQRALQSFEQIEARDSQDPETLFAFADALSLSGDWDLAAEVLRNLLRTEPNHVEARVQLGLVLAESGAAHTAEAERALRAALDLALSDEKRVVVLTALGLLLQRDLRPDEALPAYDRALALDLANARARIGKATLLARDGRVLESAELIDGLGMLDGALHSLFVGLLQDALKDFTRYGGHFADAAANHVAYAKLLVRVGRNADARLALKRATALAPGDAFAWNMLGSLDVQLGANAEAKDAYRRSLEVDPNQARTRSALDQLEGTVQGTSP